MLKRNAHKNFKKSSVDSLTIEEVDKLIYMNTIFLNSMKEHEENEPSQPSSDIPISNIYPEASTQTPTPSRNKII